jgi:hypothetical protein
MNKLQKALAVLIWATVSWLAAVAIILLAIKYPLLGTLFLLWVFCVLLASERLTR